MTPDRPDFDRPRADAQEPAEVRARAQARMESLVAEFLGKSFSDAPALVAWLSSDALRATLASAGTRDDGASWDFRVAVDASPDGAWVRALRAAALRKLVLDALEERDNWATKHHPRHLADVLGVTVGDGASADAVADALDAAAKDAGLLEVKRCEDADETYARTKNAEEMAKIEREARAAGARADACAKASKELRTEWPRHASRRAALADMAGRFAALRDAADLSAAESVADACHPGSAFVEEASALVGPSQAERTLRTAQELLLKIADAPLRVSAVTQKIQRAAPDVPADVPAPAALSRRKKLAIGALLALGLAGGGVAVATYAGSRPRMEPGTLDLNRASDETRALLRLLDTRAWLDGMAPEAARSFVLEELRRRGASGEKTGFLWLGKGMASRWLPSKDGSQRFRLDISFDDASRDAIKSALREGSTAPGAAGPGSVPTGMDCGSDLLRTCNGLRKPVSDTAYIVSNLAEFLQEEVDLAAQGGATGDGVNKRAVERLSKTFLDRFDLDPVAVSSCRQEAGKLRFVLGNGKTVELPFPAPSARAKNGGDPAVFDAPATSPLPYREMGLWEELLKCHEKAVLKSCRDYGPRLRDDADAAAKSAFVDMAVRAASETYMVRMAAALVDASIDKSNVRRTLSTAAFARGLPDTTVIFMGRTASGQPLACAYDFSARALIPRDLVPRQFLPDCDLPAAAAKKAFEDALRPKTSALAGTAPSELYAKLRPLADRAALSTFEEGSSLRLCDLYAAPTVAFLKDGSVRIRMLPKLGTGPLEWYLSGFVAPKNVERALQGVMLYVLQNSFGADDFTRLLSERLQGADMVVTSASQDADRILHLTIVTPDRQAMTAQIPVPSGMR